jgi:hypothetical protein
MRVAQGVCLALSITVAGPAVAKDKTTTGKIVRFECGDNCYLVISDGKGREVTGLCTAPQCESWNFAAEMPSKFRGVRVKVTLGKGFQVNGEGDVQAEHVAFSNLQFLL